MQNYQKTSQQPDLDAAPYCQTIDFRSDLSELCGECKLGQFIKEGIQKQIVFQAQQQKGVLTDTQFKDYCTKEITSAQEAMMLMNFDRGRHNTDRHWEANIPNNTLVHIWNKERIRALVALQQPTTDRQGKKPAARPFANFTDKLQNGFTEKDLNGLLIHVKFKDENGETLRFTKYLMHQVIQALVKEEYFERGNVEYDQKALSRYLSLPETRVTVEPGKPKKSVQKKAESYLSELKNQRKNNG